MKTLIEKLKKQNWTFTLIGTDNLDVEGMAGSLAIDNHLEFAEDDEGTKRMFARERRSRERFNRCMAADCAMPKRNSNENHKNIKKPRALFWAD